ncbi:M23 family metallopeptidase [Alsobacter sp. R-9]
MTSVPGGSRSGRSPVTLVYERGGRTRTVRLDTRLALVVGVALVLLGTWYLVATLYLVFRDDVLTNLVSRHAQLQYAYEDRIAALRSSMDRLTSRQLIDQDGVEGKVQELLARQAQLETRQAMVAALVSQAESMPRGAGPAVPAPMPLPRPASSPAQAMGGPAPSNDLPAAASSFAPAQKPQPIPEFGPLRGSGAPAASPVKGQVPAGRTADADHAPLPVPSLPADLPGPRAEAPVAAPVAVPGTAAAKLARLSVAQSIAESRQLTTLEDYAARFRTQSLRLQGVLAEVGLDRTRFASIAPANAAAQGGPFVPAKVDGTAGPFEASVDRLQRSMAEAGAMMRIVEAIPLRRPLSGDPDTTSSFGYRPDPFTRGLAMHTGVDFRDDYGSPVRVTAPGTVVAAEWSGGYGNMVEVDHGNGLSTRYAHLSQILVTEGQHVDAGAVVGKLGSTGRSTGPHLHYETRVDGEPVDPMRYLRAAGRFNRS